MRSRSVCFSFLLVSTLSFGQNLVPDPGFEDTISMYCGIFSQSNFNNSINDWYDPTAGSPDLFSRMINQSCWNFQQSSTYPGPICLKGPQLPRGGNVMAGLFCYTISGFNQREYIQVQLTTPLAINDTFIVSFYASLADNTERSINTLAAYLSVNPLTTGNDQPLAVTPQVISNFYIADTMLWTKVSDTIIATAAFKYLTIGNFNDDNSTGTQLNPGGGNGPGCYGAYYFIDDVSVINLQAKINGVSDDEKTVGDLMVFASENLIQSSFSAYRSGTADVYISDMLGRTVFSGSIQFEKGINKRSFEIQLEKGIYIISIAGETFTAQKKFIVVY